MAIRIFEVESANAGSGLVGCRNDLRSRRSVAHIVRSQVLVSFVHIADNNRYILKAPVVTAPVGRNGSSLGREILCELDGFLAEFHAHDAHPKAKEALQFFVVGAIHLEIADLLKTQYLAEKFCFATNIRNGHADALDGVDELGKSGTTKK